MSLFSWPLFCKEALPDRNFTFWEWFHRILLLTQQHLSKLWQKGFVMGFISKPLAEQMLLEKHSGTFLLRFSDSELGGVTIAYVRQPDMYPGRKYTFGFGLMSPSCHIRHMSNLKIVVKLCLLLNTPHYSFGKILY